jgi:thioredoxin reductase
MTTLYEHAGGDPGLHRLEDDFHSKVLADPLLQPNDLAAMLGCSLSAGDTIETDIDGRTGVPGVYAAGDAATEHSRSVSNAIGTGSRVAYAVALNAAAAR